MARHSKNNTAGSVFTYGERQKLKQSNEWGEMTARIGGDSQKKFEQCNLCLKFIEEPVACCNGHLFCKTCIIENLVIQKNEIKKKLKEWKDEVNKEKEKEIFKQSQKTKTLTEKLKIFQDGIEEADNEITPDNLLSISDNNLDRFKMVEELIERKNYNVKKEKIDLIKNCFWVPEITPNIVESHIKKPIEKLSCPVYRDHFIRLKELVHLKINKSKDKYCCFICQKDFAYQKIILLKKCGHVMCKKCLDSVSKKDKICSYCSEVFSSDDIILLQESGTGFSQHNQVQTNKLNPYFKF